MADRALFQLDVESRLQRHPKMIKKWIRTAKMCMAQHKKEQKKGMTKQRKITKHFESRHQVNTHNEAMLMHEANEVSVETERADKKQFCNAG